MTSATGSARNAVSAIVLAAGQSSRMGAMNKLVLPFRNGTVVEHVVKAVREASVAEVLVVTGFQGTVVREALIGYPVRFIHNPDYEQGMGSSIGAGVRAANPSSQGYLICLGDMPTVSARTYARVCTAFGVRLNGPPPIITVSIDGRRGNPVLFAAEYREELLNLSGDVGARSLLERHTNAIIDLSVTDEGVLDDVDTPEAYIEVLGRKET